MSVFSVYTLDEDKKPKCLAVFGKRKHALQWVGKRAKKIGKRRKKIEKLQKALDWALVKEDHYEIKG